MARYTPPPSLDQGTSRQRPTTGKDPYERKQEPMAGPDTPGRQPATNVPLDPTTQDIQAATSGYQNAQFGYNPYETAAGDRLQGMDWNPYRNAATNQAQSQASSDYGQLLTSLQTSGGASSADRMNALQGFNRQRILGQLGGAAKYDQAQSGSNFDAAQFNQNRAMDTQRLNAEASNDQSRMKAQQNLHRSENLYQSALDERNLNRQLKASREIAMRQGRGGGGGGLVDALLGFGKMF